MPARRSFADEIGAGGGTIVRFEQLARLGEVIGRIPGIGVAGCDERGADQIEAKLQDLETLYDVVHDEVESTALDVAATLRSVRKSTGMIGRVRRILIPSR